ncbi:MAG: bifunctional non-ous end joining protein LigD [Alphaproteobacteria bacterium]|nr:bifunctional non-ous end joining protein LigD [Alphaproteobacteria bacterium]
MASLQTYHAKRDFGKTAEPRGKTGREKGFAYVIQKHDATRLHYDLRLELDGVMLSWAVTRGPSLVPGEKRLAIHVEDHPTEYNKFEGTIPKGQYGGGTVMIWDRGTWTPDHDPHKGLKKGHLDFELHGEKLKGHWHLVRMRKRPGERQEPWLLIKATDEFAAKKSDPDVLEELPDSAVTGRSLDEIAADKKRVWQSNRSAKEQTKAAKAGPPKTAVRPAAPKQRTRTPRRRSAARRGSKKPGKVAGASKGRMPDFIPPSLATLSARPPSGGGWVHEIKFDGYRIQARIDGDKVSLKTRTGLDWTEKFPTVEEACTALADHDVILDGEIASVNENGVSDFSALQDDLKNGRHDRMAYYVFDLLHLDGLDLTGSPLIERKRALATLLAELPKRSIVKLSEHFEEDGSTMLKHACNLHLEGIVSKRADAAYHSGRTGEWLKTKCSSNQEFVVIGYEPSDKRGRLIRSLLLGYYDQGGLRYAGRVGTGWGQAAERDLQRRLTAVARKDTPLNKVPEEERLSRGVKWVEPKTVVEVDFRGWTGGKLIRQGSLKGVREDKPAKQVVREVEKMPETVTTRQAALRQKSPAKTGKAKSGKSQGVTVADVTLTHPDRVYWEDAGVTKKMLAEYYTQVWDWMRPHVVGRVLALVRCPDGATGQCFFQKHASAGIDGKYLTLVSDDGDKSITIESVQGLVSLAQAGVLEIHVRGSSIDHLEEADRLVFDLDPGPGVEWQDVIAAAREVRKRLLDLKLESFVKTTGGKGLHVVLPIKPVPWDDAKDFCRRLAEQMSAESPDHFTATIKKVARQNRIFIDYLRNSREATAIAPYSTRARPGATVSTPLTWEELGSQKTPNAFTVENLPKRLARLRRDPWEKIGRLKQSLPGAAGKTASRRRSQVK